MYSHLGSASAPWAVPVGLVQSVKYWKAGRPGILPNVAPCKPTPLLPPQHVAPESNSIEVSLGEIGVRLKHPTVAVVKNPVPPC